MRHILHIAEYIKSLYCKGVLHQVYINITKGDIFGLYTNIVKQDG